MKMTKEDFGKLAGAIDKVITKHGLKIIIEHRQNVKYVKNQFISFCWSILYASKFNCKELYNNGLHDDHIETALKRILSDFA